MGPTSIDTLLRDTTIKAIDSVAKKLSEAERKADSKVTRLLKHWNDMDAAEKEQAAGIAIATVTTAVTAIMALRRKAKSPVKSAGKTLARAFGRKKK
jgi:hypothetical protein